MGSPAQDGYEVAQRWRDATRQYRDAIVTIQHAVTSDAVDPHEALRLVATVVDALAPLGDELFGPACPVAPVGMRTAHGDSVTCGSCGGEGWIDERDRCLACGGAGHVTPGRDAEVWAIRAAHPATCGPVLSVVR